MRQDVEIESYLSRVFVMKLQDDVEATAALKLCGLEPTASRVQWLKTSGPRREEGGRPARPALAIHRDVLNRHSALMVGPVPENAKVAFTTNPTERKERDEN
jgi:mRNA-degrading endonuclease toxin of MazEF toxin-antitoxin module